MTFVRSKRAYMPATVRPSRAMSSVYFIQCGIAGPIKIGVAIDIADKIARILNGDPEYRDNWHDIAGYAKLAEDRCQP